MPWVIAVEGDVSNTLCDPRRIVRWGTLVKVDGCKRRFVQISALSTRRMRLEAVVYSSLLINRSYPTRCLVMRSMDC